MSTTTRVRQPAGVRVGGQFTTNPRAEARTELVSGPDGVAAVWTDMGRPGVREPVVGGIDMSGTATETRERALQAMRRAETIYQIAGVKAAAQDILAVYPDAVALELETNPQEGASFVGTRIVNVNGARIADFDEFGGHRAALSDLPGQPKFRVIRTADGKPAHRYDPRFAFVQVQGFARAGYTGRIDLKAAANIDLGAL